MSASQRLRVFFRVNRWLLLSLIVLAAAVYVSAHYVQRLIARPTSAGAAVATVSVVVARTAIPAMAPIPASDLVVESWPTSTAPPGAYGSLSALSGAWSTEAIAPGVPLVGSETFVPKTANVLAARIAPGDMATDVSLAATATVDGLIQPGDTISLFTTITESNNKQVTEDFMNHVKVLAVNGSMTPSTTSTAGQSETLILALPPNQIAQLLFVQQKGSVTAVLDAPHSTAQAPTPYGVTQWQTPIP